MIPAWVLTMVADERGIKARATGLIAPAIRDDVVAVGRIVDRAFGTFLRTRVLLALVVGFGVWIGLELIQQLGIATFRYQVTAAVLLGGLQLIPELGYVLGFFPILLVLGIGGPIPAVAVLVVYLVANRIGSDLVETRVSRGVLDVHPGLLIPAHRRAQPVRPPVAAGGGAGHRHPARHHALPRGPAGRPAGAGERPARGARADARPRPGDACRRSTSPHRRRR